MTIIINIVVRILVTVRKSMNKAEKGRVFDMGARQLPKCKIKNCEFNINGRCRILYDTDFKGKECPFFKESEGEDEKSE